MRTGWCRYRAVPNDLNHAAMKMPANGTKLSGIISTVQSSAPRL